MKKYFTVGWGLDDPAPLPSLCDQAERAEEAAADARQAEHQDEDGDGDANHGTDAGIRVIRLGEFSALQIIFLAVSHF